MIIGMNYECNVFVKVKNFPISVLAIQNTVHIVLNKLKKEGSVSVHCVGLKSMLQLNSTYRGKDNPTDVLSFSTVESKIPGGPHDDFGDIFVCVPYIMRQAKEIGVSFREEFVRMVVHGILHLLGFDHIQKHQASRMFSIQETCVRAVLKK